MTLSPTERQRARELADAATPGPWTAVNRGTGWEIHVPRRAGQQRGTCWCGMRGCGGKLPDGMRTDFYHEADATLAAEARTLVPRLLAALEEAEAEIEELKQLAEDRADYFASTEDRG